MIIIIQKAYAVRTNKCTSCTVYDFNYILFERSSLFILFAETGRKNNESSGALLLCQRPDYCGAVTGGNCNNGKVGPGQQ